MTYKLVYIFMVVGFSIGSRAAPTCLGSKVQNIAYEQLFYFMKNRDFYKVAQTTVSEDDKGATVTLSFSTPKCENLGLSAQCGLQSDGALFCLLQANDCDTEVAHWSVR